MVPLFKSGVEFMVLDVVQMMPKPNLHNKNYRFILLSMWCTFVLPLAIYLFFYIATHWLN